tara:strand:- start:738 stop:1118 length:381 start_codon:yes stop_codon:yes gene_type:complete
MKDQNFLKILNYIYKQNDRKLKIFSKYKDLLDLKRKKNFVLFKPKNNFLNLIKIFIFLIKNKVKFKKNFIIFTQVNDVIYGQNIFPEWANYYSQKGLSKNLIIWTKNFLLNIYNFKKLKCLLIEKK